MKRWLAIVLVFLCGVLSGVAGTGLLVEYRLRHPRPLSETTVRVLSSELRLDDEQRDAIRPVVARARDRLLEVQADARPEVEAILADAKTELRLLLSGDQQRRLDRLLERQRKQREQLLR